MAIQVDSSFIPVSEKNQIIGLRRINQEQFEELIAELSQRAEGYIKAFTFQKIEKLPKDIVKEIKELYIGWKLYAQVEWEENSKDKYDAMIELLNICRDNIIQEIKTGKDINEDQDVIKAKGIKFS